MSLMDARMSWACDDPAELEGWGPGIRLAESRTLAQLPPELVDTFSASRRELVRTMAETYAEQLETFKVNLLRLG
jgi:hypothetical protein